MRWLVRIIRLFIAAATLFFIMTWGFDAVRALASMNYGVDDPVRGQGVRALAQMLGLGPVNSVRLAAFIAAFKLTAVAAFVLDLVGRARRPDAASSYDLLEGALLLVVIATAAIAVAAVHAGDLALIRICAIDFLVAGVAAILSVVERLSHRTPKRGRTAIRPAPAPPRVDIVPVPGRAKKRASSWFRG